MLRRDADGRRHGVGQLREVTIEVRARRPQAMLRGNYTIVRTFTATDDAGNSSATQTITVQDTTAPEFTFVLADYTVEAQTRCRWKTPRRRQLRRGDRRMSRRPRLAMLQATTPSFALTATDDAGNSSSATQTITVQDTTAPEFTFVPADYTVECSDEMPMEDATASDNCGEVTIEVTSETTAGDAAGNYTIVRTCTATDDAGNSSLPPRPSRSRTPPRLEFTFVPADYTVECLGRDADGRRATASDNCGEVTIEVSSETTAGDAAGNYTIVRTFTATDDAGNSSSATQTITSRTPPRLSSPSSLPTTPSSAQTRCRWTTPRRRTTAAR